MDVTLGASKKATFGDVDRDEAATIYWGLYEYKKNLEKSLQKTKKKVARGDLFPVLALEDEAFLYTTLGQVTRLMFTMTGDATDEFRKWLDTDIA